MLMSSTPCDPRPPSLAPAAPGALNYIVNDKDVRESAGVYTALQRAQHFIRHLSVCPG